MSRSTINEQHILAAPVFDNFPDHTVHKFSSIIGMNDSRKSKIRKNTLVQTTCNFVSSLSFQRPNYKILWPMVHIVGYVVVFSIWLMSHVYQVYLRSCKESGRNNRVQFGVVCLLHRHLANGTGSTCILNYTSRNSLVPRLYLQSTWFYMLMGLIYKVCHFSIKQNSRYKAKSLNHEI